MSISKQLLLKTGLSNVINYNYDMLYLYMTKKKKTIKCVNVIKTEYDKRKKDLINQTIMVNLKYNTSLNKTPLRGPTFYNTYNYCAPWTSVFVTPQSFLQHNIIGNALNNKVT